MLGGDETVLVVGSIKQTDLSYILARRLRQSPSEPYSLLEIYIITCRSVACRNDGF
jgi:hypothetical protein